MRKITIFLFVAVALGLAAYGVFYAALRNPSAPSSKPVADPVIIGISLATLREDRWVADRDTLVERILALGGHPVVLTANNDDVLQNDQIDNLVSQGAKAIIVVPEDAVAVASAVERAKAAGIKVVAYDRMIQVTAPDLYVSFDSEKVGMMQADGATGTGARGKYLIIGGSDTDHNATLVRSGVLGALQPHIDNGEITVELDVFTPGWNPDVAYQTVKDYLSAGNAVDAVVTANDGTASGAIKALAEFGLDGKVPVTGQDAELSACRRVAQGVQTMTVYKPLRDLATKAADLTMELAAGVVPDISQTVSNGTSDVPAYLIAPTYVDAANMMETVVAAGFHSEREIYGE
jgi:D-xylose transport system substrate-binding protein